jgi:hypothetical protein
LIDNDLASSARRPIDFAALSGVAATIGLHLFFQRSGPNPAFIAAVCAGWIGYVAWQAWRDRSRIRWWGFRRDNLAAASLRPVLILGSLGNAMAAYAIWQGHFTFPPSNLVLFLLYPVWGIAQQFLALGIVTRSLEQVDWIRGRPIAIALLVATLFGSVHWPDIGAMVATFGLGLVVVMLYFQHRNLWPLGLMHGWLGAMFYLWVLDRDLFAENFKPGF